MPIKKCLSAVVEGHFLWFLLRGSVSTFNQIGKGVSQQAAYFLNNREIPRNDLNVQSFSINAD